MCQILLIEIVTVIAPCLTDLFKPVTSKPVAQKSSVITSNTVMETERKKDVAELNETQSEPQSEIVQPASTAATEPTVATEPTAVALPTAIEISEPAFSAATEPTVATEPTAVAVPTATEISEPDHAQRIELPGDPLAKKSDSDSIIKSIDSIIEESTDQIVKETIEPIVKKPIMPVVTDSKTVTKRPLFDPDEDEGKLIVIIIV